MKIHSITDTAFSVYGRKLGTYHLEELLEKMKSTPLKNRGGSIAHSKKQMVNCTS